MNRIGCVLMIAIGAAASLFGEGPVKWLEKDHDFGLIREIDGPKSARSRFINVSSDPIYIMEVKPSCGCTTASFTMNAIEPLDTGYVEYTYDPAMRPGVFDKSIKVRLSDNTRPTIKITGNVLGTPESLSTLYPLEMGQVRLSEFMHNAGEVKFGRSPLFFINAYAMGPDSVSPRMSAPGKGLQISRSSDKIAPGDVMTFAINFDSRVNAEYGPVEIPITFRSGEDLAEVPFKAFVVPDVETLLKIQGTQHPFCKLSPNPVDLGKMPKSRNATFEFNVTNDGEAPLTIYRVFADSDAMTVGKIPSKPIKPGKSARIEVKVKGALLQPGPQRRLITLICDDPRQPVKTLPVAILAE